jgi:hypothetical protein
LIDIPFSKDRSRFAFQIENVVNRLKNSYVRAKIFFAGEFAAGNLLAFPTDLA